MQMATAVESDSLRQQIVEVARSHKASWIKLGQYLYTIHKDKLFKAWGYLTFEAYCIKEVHIKTTTAQKLLKSYFFIEKEEPQLTTVDPTGETDSNQMIPNFESVNLLRLAKNNKELTPQDFSEIRESVIENGKDPKEVRAQVKQLVEAKVDQDSTEFKNAQRAAKIKRIVSGLKTARRDFASDNLLPAFLLKQMDELIDKLTDQIDG